MVLQHDRRASPGVTTQYNDHSYSDIRFNSGHVRNATGETEGKNLFVLTTYPMKDGGTPVLQNEYGGLYMFKETRF